MDGTEKSDSVIVAMKSANKGTEVPAESMERRAGPKGNPGGQSTRRAQDRVSVSQAAERIRQYVQREPRARLTTLLHHITVDALRWAFFELKRDAAAGMDGMTWSRYSEGLEGRLADLHGRVHSGAYRATPSRRVNIPKPDGGTRPLGIAALEDKIVQKAVVATILTPIYEAQFLGFSYGFRPGRGAHDALLVRYADDFVVGFQHKRDAERCLAAIGERFARFDLKLHPGKTRLIEFGRFAMANRRQRGQGKPKTFDFLGFTHYCAKDRNGRFQLGRKPIAKRVTRTLKRIKEALWRRRHRPKAETARWLGRVIDGWLNYYAVPTSFRWLDRFVHGVKRLWLRALRRRSQKDRHSWDALQRLVDTHWPSVTIRHPWPSQRLAVHTTQGRSRMP